MQRSFVITLIVFLGFSLIIFLNSAFAPFSFLASITQIIFSIPKEQLYSAKTGIVSGKKVDVEKLIAENNKLTEKVVEFDRLKQDNSALQSQFETPEPRASNILPTRVVGFLGEFANPTTLIIDKGEKDGLKKDMAVISGKNLVGKVTSVSRNFSQVMLVLHPQFTALAKSSDSQASGVVRGETSFILLDNVSITDNLSSDAIITTKGDVSQGGIGIPQDLIIGKVISLNKNNSAPFQTAKIESSVSFSRLETVFVMINNF
jgi:rod shape-determining protein MreC